MPDTFLEREAIGLVAEPWDVSTVAMLAMAGLSLLIGALWPPTGGTWSFLRRAAMVGVGAWLVAAEVGVFWWLGLSRVSQQRGIYLSPYDGPWGFVQAAALLAGLAGLAGVASRALLDGALRAVISVAGIAFVVGVILLSVNPVDPWLPHLNVQVLLFGDVSYWGPPEAEICTSRTGPSYTGLGWFGGSGEYCTRKVTHSLGAAAGYLVGGVSLLVLAGAAASARPRRLIAVPPA